jgi:SNF2 family DNA or RNA helicase
MPSLFDTPWRVKYSPDTTDNIVEAFYIPALQCAQRYWRTTGYFQATALSLAMRGIEGLIHNQGSMRLIVGCTLAPEELDAIQQGQTLRQALEASLSRTPLEPLDPASKDALTLLAWMVQHSILDIKVAVVCNPQRQPIASTAIFHDKVGILEDPHGNRLSFSGGINETYQGWTRNWDTIHVHTSWQTPAHVEADEQDFMRLWGNNSPRALVLEIPEAIRQHLLTFAPSPNHLPPRLQEPAARYTVPKLPPEEPPVQLPPPPQDPRAIVWSYIAKAPHLDPQGHRVGEVTCAITPWPHQVLAFNRMWNNWPPKLLIADEVGLGKTIQAGLLLRQAWLSQRARRILIMSPAAVLKQWQLELKEKFNLNWPIYDGKSLRWLPSPGRQDPLEQPISRKHWHQTPYVLVSSHLMRRRERMPELLVDAEPWDLVILDEAHHARRSGVFSGNSAQGRPNRLLELMQSLKHRTQGLLLLTATPMQVDPIEVWDLLNLLGLPAEWTANDFLRFFERVALPSPSSEDVTYLARLFRAIEAHYGSLTYERVSQLLPHLSPLKRRKILGALRAGSSIPLRKLETPERKAALKLLQSHTPIQALISRHTRGLLQKYYEAGKLSTPIARRHVQDEFVTLTPAERALYDAVEDYISTTYNNAAAGERNAIGFVMTIYRRRLASSFYALSQTLQKRLDQLQGSGSQLTDLEDLNEDDPLSETPDLDEAAQLEAAALTLEETVILQTLLIQIRTLPTDTKANHLKHLLTQLQAQGYQQIIVFTQFTATLDFLRQEITQSLGLRVMCFSGRGGEIFQGGTWHPLSREATKRRFRNQDADILLCTDAAAEGLNFQFCGALLNYDMPWNPMRVEQRIGRIDRLGQAYPTIQIRNLHYSDTVETDVYLALRNRIKLFEVVVGRLQPILAKLTEAISTLVFTRRTDRDQQRAALLSDLETETTQADQTSFDLDQLSDADIADPPRPEPAYTLSHLNAILHRSHLLPPGTEVTTTGTKDFAYLRPGMLHPVRVTTDADFFDQNSDSVELWSPGCPLFPNPESTCETSLEQFLPLLGP